MLLKKQFQFVFILLSFSLFLSACDQLPLDAAIKADSVQLEESDFTIRVTPKSGRITFLGEDGNIYTLNQAGTEIKAITNDANRASISQSGNAADALNYLLPTWSTNGQKLAFAQYAVIDESKKDFAQKPGLIPIKQNARPSQQDSRNLVSSFTIYASDGDGSNQQELWSGTARPIYMYWAPDQTHLSVLLQEGNSPSLHLALLSTADQSVEILDVGAPFFWDWAANGRQLITHVGNNFPSERISLLDLPAEKGGEQIEEILGVRPGRFMAPDLSPNGDQYILPIRSDEKGDDDTWLAIFNMQNRSKKVIDRIDGDVFINAGFSPDGSKVAYIASASEGGARGELAIYDLETGSRTISEEKNIIAFFWAPNSKKIAWIEELSNRSDSEAIKKGPWGLYVFDLDNNSETELLAGFQTTPQFTEVVSFYNQYQRSANIWSPASQHLVLPVVNGNKSEIMLINANGRILPRKLATGTLAFWSAE